MAGIFLLSFNEAVEMTAADPNAGKFIFDFVGSQELVKGIVRNCLWIEDHEVEEARLSERINLRLDGVCVRCGCAERCKVHQSICGSVSPVQANSRTWQELFHRGSQGHI